MRAQSNAAQPAGADSNLDTSAGRKSSQFQSLCISEVSLPRNRVLAISLLASPSGPELQLVPICYTVCRPQAAHSAAVVTLEDNIGDESGR